MTNTESLCPIRFSSAAQAGLRVFPVRPRDKKPAGPWTKYRETPASPEQISSWDSSDCNVGVICGRASGIIVVDIDSEDAAAYYAAQDPPKTPCVKTAKGHHYYFAAPNSEIGNRVGVDDRRFDVRGDGGYVVGAGSIHESGVKYEWVVSPDEVPFAELPPKLLDLIRKPNAPTVGHSTASITHANTDNRFMRYLKRILKEKAKFLREAEEGRRNDTLFRVAVSLANDVAGAYADWSPFADALLKEAKAAGLDEREATATLASAWRKGSANPTKWMVEARNWVYLSYPQLFHHLESGKDLRRPGFNSAFAGVNPWRGAFDKTLLSRSYIDVYHDLTYQPTLGLPVEVKDGLRYLNSYRPSDVEAVEGDPAPFLDFVEYLVPDEGERKHLLLMMAHTVRFPEVKLRHALLLRSEVHGVGKSMFVDIWGRLLGETNVRRTSTEEMSGNFDSYLWGKLLIVLEELNWGVGPMGYNRLKALITENIVPVNEKFIPVREFPNFATWVFLTNVRTPLIIEKSDRRIFFIDSPASKRSPDYYTQFVAWWQTNLGVIRNYLDQVDLTNFNPNVAPPMTQAKLDLIASSGDELTRELSILIEERAGVFQRDIVTLVEIEQQLGSAMRNKSVAALRRALGDIGAVSFGQQRVPAYWIDSIFVRDQKRVSLWAIRHPKYWQNVSPAERADEYARVEGMFCGFDPKIAVVRHASEWPSDNEEFFQQFRSG